MTFYKDFNKIEKIRYVLSNHTMYNNFEAFSNIMLSLKLTKEEFDVNQEPYWYTNNWWDNNDFLITLKAYGIDINKTIRIKYDKETIKNLSLS